MSKKRILSKNRRKRVRKQGKGPPCHLVELYLSEASVSRPGIRHGVPPPGHVKVEVKCQGGELADHKNHLGFSISLQAIAGYEEEGEPAVRVRGDFVIVYKFKDLKKFSPEAIAGFSQRPAMMHVWPYWREFVQSATSRMGLPPLRMPLLFPGSVPGEPPSTQEE